MSKDRAEKQHQGRDTREKGRKKQGKRVSDDPFYKVANPKESRRASAKEESNVRLFPFPSLGCAFRSVCTYQRGEALLSLLSSRLPPFYDAMPSSTPVPAFC